MKHCTESFWFETWIPKETLVVLGSSNSDALELNQEAFSGATSPPRLRRAGGGGAVVLHDGCLIVGVGAWVKHMYRNEHYFSLINGALIEGLRKQYPLLGSRLSQRGISDICCDDKKIAGTSMFRSKNYLLFQASFLIDAKADLIARYLNHPSKEPDYRQGRTHRDFIMGLRSVLDCSCEELLESTHDIWRVCLEAQISSELVPPDAKHIEHILQRSKNGD